MLTKFTKFALVALISVSLSSCTNDDGEKKDEFEPAANDGFQVSATVQVDDDILAATDFKEIAKVECASERALCVKLKTLYDDKQEYDVFLRELKKTEIGCVTDSADINSMIETVPSLKPYAEGLSDEELTLPLCAPVLDCFEALRLKGEIGGETFVWKESQCNPSYHGEKLFELLETYNTPVKLSE